MLELCIDNRLGGLPRYFTAYTEESLMLVPPEVRESVAFVCYKKNGKTMLAGTCFFVGVRSEEIGLNFVYIVTARHIIGRIKQKSDDLVAYIRMNKKDGKAGYMTVSIDHWLYHPDDSSVDVAVLPAAPPSDVFDYMLIPIEMAAIDEVLEEEKIGVGDEVFLTGLFTRHYGTEKNLPIVRIGNIALMPEERIPTKLFGPIDAYLVEARSIGGISGSPVFVYLGGIRRNVMSVGKFYWLGLMHGHWDLPELEPDVVDDEFAEERVNMGIAIVVPAQKIVEIINQEKLVISRQEAIDQQRAKRAPTPDSPNESDFTKKDFTEALRKVSQRKSDQEQS